MATQSAGRRLTAPLVRAYEEAAALAALAGAHAGSAAAAARADYGGRAARYLPLAGACADSGPVGEGILRGGSTTVTPKTYSYVVCAFANVTQREVGAAAWAAAEAAAKAGSGGGSGAGVVGELAVAPDGAVASPPPAPPARDPPPQLVGLFRGWVAHRDLAAHFAAGLSRLGRDPLPASPDVLVSADALPRGPDGEPEPAALFYEGVEPCASGAMRARRRTWVLLTCGDAIGTGGGGGGGTYGGGGGGGGVDLGDATSIDAAAPWGFRALATGRGWGPRGGSNDTAGAVDGGGGGGPSLVERMLRAAHPSVPARFVPRRLNARAAGGGPLRVLHVAEDGLCNTIAWAAAAAACDRAAAGGARRLASAAAAHAAPEAEDL